MIGNDIVDLEQARRESNWRRSGFLAKVFTDHEQRLIQQADDPDVLAWLLWSLKESAYKAIVRETGHRFFAPRRLVCHLNHIQTDLAEGSVFYQKTYPTKSIITTRYVASVAFSADVPESLTHKIITFDSADYSHQHAMIRKKIKQHYVTRFPICADSIQIRKDNADVPVLVLTISDGNTICKPISLSHHGQYGAFAALQQPTSSLLYP